MVKHENYGIKTIGFNYSDDGSRELVSYELIEELNGANLLDYVNSQLDLATRIELKNMLESNFIINSYDLIILLQQFVYNNDKEIWEYKKNYFRFADEDMKEDAPINQEKYYGTVLKSMNYDMVNILNGVLKKDKVL